MHTLLPFRRAFTLLEVLIVVVVIGILAAVVIPQFSSATTDARAAALQSTLAGVRAGIASYRTRAILESRDPFPTAAEVRDDLLPDGLPRNPFSGATGLQEVNFATANVRGTINNPTVGWLYHVDVSATPPIAIFYANSTVVVDGRPANQH